jgi:hypothetical protein
MGKKDAYSASVLKQRRFTRLCSVLRRNADRWQGGRLNQETLTHDSNP